MSASASNRMPDLGYKAVPATLVRPAAYQHGWTNGTMTDIQAVTASSIHLCIYSLTMYVNEGPLGFPFCCIQGYRISLLVAISLHNAYCMLTLANTVHILVPRPSLVCLLMEE